MIEIAQEKTAALEVDLQFAAFQDASVLIAQNRKQNLVVQIGFERLPVDVEIGRVGRARSVLEHVHPPVIVRLADAHVVRDEIEDLSHPVRVQLGDPGVVFLARADRGIQLVVIGDVVAVQAFRARLEVGRRIAIADPERVQIRHDLARLREGELPVELQPVGRGGNARVRRAHGRANLDRIRMNGLNGAVRGRLSALQSPALDSEEIDPRLPRTYRRVQAATENARGQFAERQASRAGGFVGFQNRTRFVESVEGVGQLEEIIREQIRTKIIQHLRDGLGELSESFGQSQLRRLGQDRVR